MLCAVMDSSKETAECAFLNMYMDRLDTLEKDNTKLQNLLSEYLGPVHTPARNCNVAHVKHYKPSLVTPNDRCLVCCEIVGQIGNNFLDTTQGLSCGYWPAKELFQSKLPFVSQEQEVVLDDGASWSVYRRAGATLQFAVWTEDSLPDSHEAVSWTARYCADLFCQYVSQIYHTEDFQFWWLNEADFKLLQGWCNPFMSRKRSKAQQTAMDAARAKMVTRQELGLDIPWIFKHMLDEPDATVHQPPRHV